MSQPAVPPPATMIFKFLSMRSPSKKADRHIRAIQPIEPTLLPEKRHHRRDSSRAFFYIISTIVVFLFFTRYCYIHSYSTALLPRRCLLFDSVTPFGVFLRKELNQPSRWGDTEHSQRSDEVRGSINDALPRACASLTADVDR